MGRCGLRSMSIYVQTEPPAQALGAPGGLVTHSGPKNSHLALGAPEALSSVFQMKTVPEHLGLEQAPLGTEAWLGTVSVKVPLWASLPPASGQKGTGQPSQERAGT